MQTDIATLILPGCCQLCLQSTQRGIDLCAGCERDLPRLDHTCRSCAMPLPSAPHRDKQCGACLQRPPPQHAARAVFSYRYPLDHLVRRFKFNNDQASGKLLGQLFAQHVLPVAASPIAASGIVLLPVPLHAKRLRERGFNQAELLAQAISAQHGCQLNNKLLERIRETQVQSDMSAQARRRNVRNAFSVRSAMLPQHVAIVDDVVTTGSTTREIAALLRNCGVAKIEVWSLARTVGVR